MNNLVIIHFAPIELYPPIQNLLRCLKDKADHKNLLVISTKSDSKRLSTFKLPLSKIKFYRIAKSGKQLSSIERYVNYVFFYSFSLVLLILKRPAGILYFETISCWPVYIYKRFINKKCQVFIHFHEYVSLDEYNNGTALVKYFYSNEKWLLPIANWVSQTNEKRLELFLRDIYPISLENQRVLPNYPPKAWYRKAEKKVDTPIRIVYIGALSLSTMYTIEFANWVLAQNGQVHWDIYCLNYEEDTKRYLERLDCGFISIKDGVGYDELPGILENYSVGVILYKGHIDNYVYNAPNKLFEYLAIGLDVWFPRELTGTQGYARTDRNPKILSVDFKNMDDFDLHLAIRRNTENANDDFFCEIAFNPLLNKIRNDVDSVLA